MIGSPITLHARSPDVSFAGAVSLGGQADAPRDWTMLSQVVYSASPRFAHVPKVDELPYVSIVARHPRPHVVVSLLDA
jgi:hypothetical protein